MNLRSIRRTLAFIIPLALFLLTSCQCGRTARNHADVAIYSDKGCWEESVKAAEKMFQWMGYSVALIDARHVKKIGLNDFRLLCVPGGDMYQYAQSLSSRGEDSVRAFIHSGGAYIGICGGAYFAASKVVWQGNELPMKPLGLFDGTAKGPINEIVPHPKYGMCQVNITDSTDSIVHVEPDSLWMLYYWGPEFIINESQRVFALAEYENVHRTMMMAFEYGNGRVFLVGTHPEIEEDSDRDSVTFADELDDKGSDWELMKQAVHWCLKEGK
jgi:glutamine amidotransferase-like uncharacterized protein